MLILVPLRPVALVLGLLSGLILVGFIGSSLLDKTNPLALGASQLQHAVGKQNDSHASPEHNHSHRTAPKQVQ
jgi:hypothetical protein